jgi:uncharacterized protein YjbJ (UPF0337 family)
MKLPWILAAASGAAIVAYIVLNTPGPEYATGNDSIEDAARNTAQWGSKSRIRSVRDTVRGTVKQTAGKLMGDDDLAGEGVVDQVAGAAKEAAGQVAQAAGETLHELNR